eukprot:gnl/TRDRNA2_/TRDRNA2_148627_c0_seq1.p1 gnl/TRDRNA2_/TRDRNA2_148627_c0~~gnl/TRDRNA2_/TRDRNA2_148627_c0_seq1.p1  ORF type:complete len:300 (-),score=38.57 gnl/TRDRNA2_/TRDRNA2_148627_c0_seq1:7-885(-)
MWVLRAIRGGGTPVVGRELLLRRRFASCTPMVRRVVTQTEETRMVMEKSLEMPLRRVVVSVVMANPLAAKPVDGYVEQLRVMQGFTAQPLKKAGFSVQELADGGFTAGELREAGFSLTDLKDAGFHPWDLRDAGFSIPELQEAGFSESAAHSTKEGQATSSVQGAATDMSDLDDMGTEIGRIAGETAMEALKGPVSACGKAVMVGADGDTKHGDAVVRSKFSAAVGEAFGCGVDIMASTDQVQPSGTHADAYPAPEPDEIVVVLAVVNSSTGDGTANEVFMAKPSMTLRSEA